MLAKGQPDYEHHEQRGENHDEEGIEAAEMVREQAGDGTAEAGTTRRNALVESEAAE